MMTRIISALLLALAASFVQAADPAPLQVADNAPDRHIVVPGDTLWGFPQNSSRSPGAGPRCGA